MIRSILFAGAALCSVPALAQSMSEPVAPDAMGQASTDSGVAISNMTGEPVVDVVDPVPGQPMEVTQPTPMVSEPPATASMSSLPASTTYAAAPSAQAQRLSHFDFSGDWGEIGGAEWGVAGGATMSADATTATGEAGMSAPAGVGGPIDVASEWSELSPSGEALTPLAFGTWVLEQNGKDVGAKVEKSKRSRAANLPAVQVLNVTAGAFAEADADNDMRISQAELQTFAGA